MGIGAATPAYKATDAGILAPPAGFRHFLGEPTVRFRWRGRDPRLVPAARDDMRRHLAVVAAAMEAAPDPQGKPRLPSGYTYALQLVAHDMVDTTMPFWAMSKATETRNLQTRPLHLNTIYGGGPFSFPLAYEADPNSGGELIAFRLGRALAGAGQSDPVPSGRDIPRVSLASTTDDAAADGLNATLLADGRNDQQLVLSQMTVLFMLLHNAILAMLPPVAGAVSGAAADARVAETRFACARAATVLVYRQVLRQDILPHILHPAVRKLYAAGLPRLEAAPGPPGLPLEFSHGAFRIGHAMVRSGYQIRPAKTSAQSPIGQLLRLNSAMFGLGFPLITNWMVDWSNFLPLADRDPANMARPIGATSQAAFAQDDRFGPIHSGAGKTGVAIRDLMSAGLAGLWSVWALIDAIGAPFASLLAPARGNWPAQLTKWHDSLPPLAQPGPTTMQALEDDPPLSFFVLLEAASASDHAGLGVLGSIIVAETILGALAREPLPVELAANNQRARLRQLGKTHAFGDALSALSDIDSLAGIVRCLAGTPALKRAKPPLFTAARAR